METITVNITPLDREEKVNHYEAFGWMIQTELPTKITFMRNDALPIMKKVKKLENDYKKVEHPFPVIGCSFLVVGIVITILALTLSFNSLGKLILLIFGIACLGIGVILITNGIIFAVRKKEILSAIIDEARKTLCIEKPEELPIIGK